jgi:methyltransferase
MARYDSQPQYPSTCTIAVAILSLTAGLRTKPTAIVETGLPIKIPLSDCEIPKNTRVTVKLTSQVHPELGALAVDPAAPREEAGYYWGYQVRRAESLSAVFTESPFDGGYDLSVGTSERGVAIADVLATGNNREQEGSAPTVAYPAYRHLLVVLGGVAGIEAAISADPELISKGLTPNTAADLFDYWVNVLPHQGSRTIRTEEAVWLALMALRPWVERQSIRPLPEHGLDGD